MEYGRERESVTKALIISMAIAYELMLAGSGIRVRVPNALDRAKARNARVGTFWSWVFVRGRARVERHSLPVSCTLSLRLPMSKNVRQASMRRCDSGRVNQRAEECAPGFF